MRSLLTLLLILAIPFNAVFAAGERLCDELGRFSGHAGHVGHHLSHAPATDVADTPSGLAPPLVDQAMQAIAMDLAGHDHPAPGGKNCHDHCQAHTHSSVSWLMPSPLHLPQAPQQLHLNGRSKAAFSSILAAPPERPPRTRPLFHAV